MDIRQKLRQLLVNNKQSSTRVVTSPIETTASLPGNGSVIETHNSDVPTDEETLGSVENVYFSGSSFDASEYVLQKLPDVFDLNEIHNDRQKLRRQLQVVSKRVSDLILQNQPSYVKELRRVTELQNDLHIALDTCRTGRNYLDQAKNQFTIAGLGILANYGKRQQIIGLLRSLRTVKTLQQTDVRLREMLDEEDFPGAIQLCLECQKAAGTFKHFKCISELTSKLQDTLEMIEEHLDVALSKVCNNFNTEHYEKLQVAYKLLGKTQMAMDQLHMHFTSAIHNTAFIIVLGYVELYAEGKDFTFHKSQYSELCKQVTSDGFTPCLSDLCKALWEVVHSYRKIMEWHEMQDKQNLTDDSDNGGIKVEGPFNKQYVHTKLEHGVTRIWQDVQQKVKTYLLASDLSGFKFNEFIRVLGLVNRLIDTGEEFCGSKSEDLQESVRKHSINYFRTYHRARMEELRMFLENEGWELCPVKCNFTITQLLEYRFLRTSKLIRSSSLISSGGTPSSQSEDFQFSETRSFHITNTNPFDITMDDDEKEDVLDNGNDGNRRSFDETDSSDDSDIPDELKRDFVDEQTGDVALKKQYKFVKKQNYKSSKGHAPILTNTTLNVLRLFGKYMQMMIVLKHIPFDVIIYMTQLFEYYMFAVANFFASGTNENIDLAPSSRLRSTLKRIADNLILEDEVEADVNSLTADSRNRDKVLKPKLSPTVGLSHPETLFGLSERIVAAESLVFLAEQFEFLQRYLDVLIPAGKKTFLQQFYSQTVIMARELRRPIYVTVAANAVNSEQILSLMSNVKWDVCEIMSQHSSYVDVLLREIQIFGTRMNEVNKQVPIPREAYDILWEYCIRIVNRTFVEGFANVKKCSNEGRALMQLDFQQFLIKLEKITDLRPTPDKDFVESYIKAYYLPDTTMEDWLKNHTEYSVKQITALLNCVSHINKKTRQKLITMTEETRK